MSGGDSGHPTTADSLVPPAVPQRRSTGPVVFGVLFGLAAGALLGVGSLTLKPAPAPQSTPTPQAPAADRETALTWRMGSAFPSALAELGSAGPRFAKLVNDISGGAFAISVVEPGAAGPIAQLPDAVRAGRIDAAWGIAAYWGDATPAAALFGGAPFGPDATGFLAWLRFGGGQELHDELYAARGLKGIPCAVGAAEGGGWFKKEIRTTRDLDGLRMRVYGLPGKVVSKLGVKPVLPDGDIYAALERGVIDAAEYSSPAVDAAAAFDRVAKFYYFPGWHQQTTVVELLMSLSRWQALSGRQRAQIEVACGDTLQFTLAQSEAAQAAAIPELRRRGVRIQRWPDRVVADLRKRWDEVVAEESRKDPAFARVMASLREFTGRFAGWRELGEL